GLSPPATTSGAKVWGCRQWHRTQGRLFPPSEAPAVRGVRAGPSPPLRAVGVRGAEAGWHGAVGKGPGAIASAQRWEEPPVLPVPTASLVLASSSAYKRFSELLPKEERENACSARLPESRILTLPELRANPFQHQICRAFSTSEEGDGSMSFEDFLDMLSVFSDTATLDIKSHYAFRIFDFDGDGVLDRKDLEKLVNCLTGDGEESRLSTAEMEQLIQNILEESDIDKDGTINLSEFQHIVSRSPDFTR
uniref:Calcium and integrin binding 1 n=1 Tax=Otus sunia TaxID=257818 RepID=A0A8C8BFL5_9STRI